MESSGTQMTSMAMKPRVRVLSRQSATAGGRVITLGVPSFRGASSSLDRFFVVLASAIDLRGPEVGLGL